MQVQEASGCDKDEGVEGECNDKQKHPTPREGRIEKQRA